MQNNVLNLKFLCEPILNVNDTYFNVLIYPYLDFSNFSKCSLAQEYLEIIIVGCF